MFPIVLVQLLLREVVCVRASLGCLCASPVCRSLSCLQSDCASSTHVFAGSQRKCVLLVQPCHRVLASDLTLGGFCGAKGSVDTTPELNRKVRALLLSSARLLSPADPLLDGVCSRAC